MKLKDANRLLKKSKKIDNKINKKEYKNFRKIIKIERRQIRKEKNLILNEAPHLKTLEEIGNAITHGIGALIAIISIFFMLKNSSTLLEKVASLVYGVSLFLMMLMSCLYHSFKWGTRVKRLWRRFDYSSIYLLIGGTFSPLLLIELGGIFGLVWFIIMWLAIITGVTMVAIFGPGRLKWLHFPLYFVLGWSGLMMVPSMIDNNVNLLWWILIGGIIYTFGMIPFVKRNVKGSHFIWHFFVLAGAICHLVGIYLTVFVK